MRNDGQPVIRHGTALYVDWALEDPRRFTRLFSIDKRGSGITLQA